MSDVFDGIRLVSWDVDGTLYSERALRRALWRRVLSLRNLAEVSGLRATLREVNRQRAGDARVRPERAPTDPTRLAAQEEFLTEFLKHIPPRPEVIGLLERAKAAGIRQVVLSDFPCEKKLAALGLSGFFDSHAVGATSGFWKPSPTLFRQLESQCAVTPGQHLHIGDRDDTDGAGARAAGCRFLRL